MKIAILGFGKEGKAVETYFKSNNEITIFDNFDDEKLKNLDLSGFDLVFRSPSVKPLDNNWTSVTKYFFDNCICPIIGITGTKGKGTTCSLLADILKNLGKTVHLVGNIGNPAIEILDKISPDDVVIYELSSFQLWDLSASPHIAVVLRIEPDHLDVHKDFSDYTAAKSNNTKFQTEKDFCIFYQGNENSKKIADFSAGTKLSYPLEPSPALKNLLNSLSLKGAHNQENAEAALLAAATYFDLNLDEFLTKNAEILKTTFENFKGLPHRLEFVRELDGIKFYDDNFSTTLPSLEVALKAFDDQKLVLIAGGKDKTENKNLPLLANILKTCKNLCKVVLIGTSGHKLAKDFPADNFVVAESLEEAVNSAFKLSKETGAEVVLMSPAAASFDMFKNAYDRGDQFQTFVKNL